MDLATEEVKIPKNSNAALYVREAANWTNEARKQVKKLISTGNLSKTELKITLLLQEQINTTIRWLEKTGCSDILPDSITNIRISS